MLAEHGARAVMTEYDDAGVVSAVSFRLDYKGQGVFFRLPSNVDPVYVILQNKADRASHRTRDHAAAVAWRVIRQWIEAQLAIVQAEQVEMVEVFLPFAQNPQTGETVFEQLARNKFALLTGPTDD